MSNIPTAEQKEMVNEVAKYFDELIRLWNGECLENATYKHLCNELVEYRDELNRKNKELLADNNEEGIRDEGI